MLSSENKISKLYLEDGKFIAYKYLISISSKKDYVFFYIHGYSDSMKEAKSMFMEQYAQKNNIDLIKFDLFGHGDSSEKRSEMTLDEWLNCSKMVLEKIVRPLNKKIVFIGSSLGGWISYLLSIEYKDLAKGVIGIGGAVDFYTKVIEPEIKPEDRDKQNVLELIFDDGVPTGEFVTKKQVENSKKYDLLTKKEIDILCPVRLVHGLGDPVVDYHLSLQLAEKIKSKDVKIYLEKNMNHDLTIVGNLDSLEKIMDGFISELN